MNQGLPPRLLDLFCGCGGLSLGFAWAGYVSLGGIDADYEAAQSYAANFHNGDENCVAVADVAADPAVTLEKMKINADSIDVIVGGPPCPAFTRVGRAKLREIYSHPEAFRHDPRARLWQAYLGYVEATQPVAAVLENVADILNWGGVNVGEEIATELSRMGYISRYTLLNSVHYGVPQVRERFFLVAIHESVGGVFEFPLPTHYYKLPRGYDSSRIVALRVLRDGHVSSPYFTPTPNGEADLAAAVTVREAIGDLPPIDINSSAYRKRGARDPSAICPYDATTRASSYAQMMRRANGAESSIVTGHVTRCLTDRDHRVFEAMKADEEYPQAYARAKALFRRLVIKKSIKEGTEQWRKLLKKYVPPYDPAKYPNKWCKMAPDRPARTLMAHLGKDGYSHIHYEQPRVISVREAARLQSFPDDFVFIGKMNSAFRQIGNAVPPLLALALAQSLKKCFSVASVRDRRK